MTNEEQLTQQIVEVLNEHLRISEYENIIDGLCDFVDGIPEAATALLPLLQQRETADWYKPEEKLPPAKPGWQHSEQVLVHYEGGEVGVETFGIAYYHYDSPYAGAKWIDFHHMGRTPDRWQPITTPQ